MKEFFYLRSLKDHRPKCDGVKVLSAHWQRSPVNGEYMCGVPGCSTNETWQGMYGVRQHFFAEHVTEEDKVFKCDYCDARFAYKTMKSEHMRKDTMTVPYLRSPATMPTTTVICVILPWIGDTLELS